MSAPPAQAKKSPGKIFVRDDRVASVVTGQRLVVVDADDLPEKLPSQNKSLTFTAQSDFSRLAEVCELASDIDSGREP